MPRVAVTGSTGMIGSHMVQLLSLRDIEVVALRHEDWDLSNWGNYRQLDEKFGKVDAVFHFAAQLPKQDTSLRDLFDVNVRSCLNLAEWATLRGVHLIFLSGATVYTDTTAKNICESDDVGLSGIGGFYGYSKRLAENVLEFNVSQGLKLTVIRPSSVYGYGLAADKAINIFLDRARKGEPIRVTSSENKVNLVHAMDVAYSAFQVYETGRFGTYNIAAEKLTSFYELAKSCANIFGADKIERVRSVGDTPVARFDLSYEKAQRDFGYHPRISLSDGLRAICDKSFLTEKFP